MILTTAQLQAIKADIAANGDLNAFPNTSDGNQAIANLYNVVVSAFIVWRSSVPPADYRGQIVWSEVSALTAGLARIWEWVSGVNTLPINAADANVRAGIAAAFVGTATLTNLTAVAKRSATRIEKLLATGTGTSASPAVMNVEGLPTGLDILAARNS